MNQTATPPLLGRAWPKNMGENLPVFFPTKAEHKAACRLLSNPRICMEHVLKPQFEASAERCGTEPVVLALQDTTALNCSGLEATTGLDGIGGGGKGGATQGAPQGFVREVSRETLPRDSGAGIIAGLRASVP